MKNPALSTAVAALLVILAPRAPAQFQGEIPESSILEITELSYRITLDQEDGTPLSEFVDVAQPILGKTIDYPEGSPGEARLRLRGTMEVPRHAFWTAFQSILKANSFVVVPIGNVKTSGAQTGEPESGVLAIRSLRDPTARPGVFKSHAQVVLAEDLSRHRFDEGLVLTTSFRLEHVNCQEATNMLQTYFTDPMIESVRAVPTSNAIVVTGFATTLHAARELLRQIDVEPPPHREELSRIPLRHAAAREVVPLLIDLTGLRAPAAAGAAGAPHLAPTPSATLPARIEPDPRTNAVLVLGPPEAVERVKKLVAVVDVPLDTPRPDRIADTRVRRVQHAQAAELAETLTRWVRQTGLDGLVEVVADVRSNSLLLTVPAASAKDLDALVDQLDVPVED